MAWTAATLTDLATGYWPAAALIAAVELRVFDALADRGTTTVDLAKSLELPADRLAALLDALTAMQLLTKSTGGDYAIASDAKRWLARSSPTCMLDALAYNADLYRQWADLANVVRGQAPARAGMQLGTDPVMTRRFVLGMEAKANAFAPAACECLDLSGVRTLLDVGAGPGTLTRMLLPRHPQLSATLLDLPAVLGVTRDLCRAGPVADRLAFHEADYRRGPLPGPFDAILYAGALHQETADSAAALFARFRQALTAGGRVFVIDLMLDDGRTAPAFSALFQLNMMLLRPGATVFTSSYTEQLLRAAGFADVSTVAIRGTPYRLTSARG